MKSIITPAVAKNQADECDGHLHITESLQVVDNLQEREIDTLRNQYPARH